MTMARTKIKADAWRQFGLFRRAESCASSAKSCEIEGADSILCLMRIQPYAYGVRPPLEELKQFLLA